MTRWGRSDSDISLRNRIFADKAGRSGDIFRAATAHMSGFVEYLLQRTSSSALLVRSLPVTTIAATGGVVFSLGVAAAIAPADADSTPRVANESASIVHVAKLHTAPAGDDSIPVQAAFLALPADTDADTNIVTGTVATNVTLQAPADAPVTDVLRGSLSTDPVSDINASFSAEQEDTQTAELLGPPSPVRQTVNLEIESGDTLGRVLTNLGVASEDARAAVNALAEHFSPRDLKIGQALEVELETLPVEVAALEEADLEAPAPSLVSFNLKADSERSLRVTYNAETSDFESQEIFRELTKEVVRAEGTSEGSLF